MKRLLLPLALVVAVACHKGPTSPEEDPSSRGRLSGTVTIGPFCPVVSVTQPCPTPPSAYAERKILVYDATKDRLLNTVDIDSRGFYLIDLRPATYVIDIKRIGLDRTGDVPKSVVITAKVATSLNVNVDTGIR